MKKILSLFLLILFTAPFSASAAILILETGSEKYGPGDSFAVDVKIDLDTGCINTADIELEFDNEYLVMENFISGDSLLSIWVNHPKQADFKRINQSGLVNFTGGIPGGYCGKVPGDPGGRSNVLGRIIFSVPKLVVGDLDEAMIRFTDNTKVLLNDGLGTIDVLETDELILELSLNTSIRDESWQEQIKTDKIPPEPFVVEIHRNAGMFEGRYFIIFSTSDKQSGIDRYEVMEASLDQLTVPKEKKWYEKIFTKEKEETPPEWVIADMPYPLRDQSLHSVIRVRAIDKAGNERLVEYFPPAELREQAKEAYRESGSVLLFIVLGSIIILLALAAFIIYKFIIRRKYDKENSISADDKK